MRVRTWVSCGLLTTAFAGWGAVACSSNGPAFPDSSSQDAGGDTTSGSMTVDSSSGANETGVSDAGSGAESGEQDTAEGGGPTNCIMPSTPQSCTPPTADAGGLPICTLALTGCMDAKNPTSFAASAHYYEVNSPLWSDGAAKTRAFVLPAGGKIHVKNCEPDAGATALADCMAGGSPNGVAATGQWEFPVGTVMIKNFMFGGKFVETRLLMHVDAVTASTIGNGTDWVGYTYQWNDAQTEATVLSGVRTEVMFNTGTDAGVVNWRYPSFSDCIKCHSAAMGTLGPETDQMDRMVNGANQIDTFVAAGLFDDTAPTAPYPPPMVEPYVNAALGLTGTPGSTLDQQARSYLAANCGVCHQPAVVNEGFDLRYSLSLFGTGICGQSQPDQIPGTTMNYLDLVPGDHADSATWLRMNIQVPSSDPTEMNDVGRMPPLASYVVDQQGLTLIAQWIDSIKSCPDAGP
jgi:hypothetical protein